MTKHLDLTLQDSLEYTGRWWLPAEPDKEIGGTLFYSPPEGIHLNLEGTFDSFPPKKDGRFSAGVINGVTSNRIICTLLGNSQIGSSFGSPGYPTQKFISDLLILGGDFSSHDQLIYSKWRVNFEHLEEWVSASLISPLRCVDEDGNQIVMVTGRTETCFDEHIDAVEGRIRLTTDLNSSQTASDKFELSSEAFLEIEPLIPARHEQLQRWSFDLQRLLSLLIVENLRPRKIHGYVNNNDEYNPSASLGVSVFFRLANQDIPKRVIHQQEMVLTFDDLKNHLATAFERWLSADHGIRQAVNLFFTASNQIGFDLETKFVNLTQGLESYHRSLGKGQYLSKDNYQPFLDMMIENIPNELDSGHIDALKSRLRYGYEYSQRKRLQKLFETMSNDLQDLITSDYQAFVGDIVDTRNYFVHRDKAIKDQALEWPELLYAYSRLKMLTTILFLKYLGLNDQTIYRHVSKNRKLKQFIGTFEEEE